jgi:hypothetical protein
MMPHMPLFRGRGLSAAVAVVAVCVVAARPASSQSVSVPYRASMTAAEIVDQIQLHNQSRTDELKHFKALRHYAVEYKGFSTTIAADMDVEVTYDASSGKSFRVVSQSGSKFLCEKVLQRAVDSEKEASADKNATALTAANYKFQLTGTDVIEGRPAYVLRVDPLTESKFLYRGRIWVDAVDFAVVKIEAEPAKNPSFWISRTQIDFTSAKTGDFWLPQQNRSETKVRVGGTAVLTIDYGTYQIASNEPHCCVGTK